MSSVFRTMHINSLHPPLELTGEVDLKKRKKAAFELITILVEIYISNVLQEWIIKIIDCYVSGMRKAAMINE